MAMFITVILTKTGQARDTRGEASIGVPNLLRMNIGAVTELTTGAIKQWGVLQQPNFGDDPISGERVRFLCSWIVGDTGAVRETAIRPIQEFRRPMERSRVQVPV